MNFTKDQINKIQIQGLNTPTIPTYKGGSKLYKVPHPSQRPQPSQPYKPPAVKTPAEVVKPQESQPKDKTEDKDKDNDNDNDDDSTDSVKSVGSKSVTTGFVKRVEEYVSTDNEIREAETSLKQLKDDKKASEEYIIKYLDTVGESSIDIANGKLRKNASDTKGPLKQDTIKEAFELEVTARFDTLIKSVSDIHEEAISKKEVKKVAEVNNYLQTLKDIKDKFKIKDTAEKSMTRMDEMREMRNKVNLKRTFNKAKKEKPKKKPIKKKA